MLMAAPLEKNNDAAKYATKLTRMMLVLGTKCANPAALRTIENAARLST